MAESRVFTGSIPRPRRIQAGIISKIRLENFMCHSHLEIELGEWVNFITGQNGSGKSAILTALCVAFGCRAKSTQRANTMKDFIKTGCSYALVHIELKNQGEDAFRPGDYGDVVIVERRITESTSSITLKNYQGKKVATGKEELLELVNHFNIDVENPCVIMAQDKSREFLNSGSSKDKFKFYYKATLLQQLGELLKSVEDRLNQATDLIALMEESLCPILKEIDALEKQIKEMEQVEEISQEVQQLKKKLAWSWVYNVDKQLQEQMKWIETLKGRLPTCQARIDQQKRKMEELSDQLNEKKAQIDNMIQRTLEVRRKKDCLEQTLQLAMKEKIELEGDRDRETNRINNLVNRIKCLEQQIDDMQDQYLRNTQVEEYEMEQKLKEILNEIVEGKTKLESLKEEENSLSESIAILKDKIKAIGSQIEANERNHGDLLSQIRNLQRNQTNRVTAFGGDWVTKLLQVIERHHREFRRPPIGPIGAHVTLVHGDFWAIAIENAIGGLLNAFIVSDHHDFLRLRACAKEVGYNHLKIIIYEFSRPSLDIPSHMLPQTNHPTAISVLQSNSPTVMNVLIDAGSAERQVLVKDYNAGKTVAFDQRISNLKEVYTSDGYKMFSRGSVQTILPPIKNRRGQRLCGSYDNQIKNLEREASAERERAQEGSGIKRKMQEELCCLEDRFQLAKRRRQGAERYLSSKELELQDMKRSFAADASSVPASTVDELHQEIPKVQEEMQEREILLEKLQMRLNEAGEKADTLKTSFENLCESAKVDIDALEEAEREMMITEKEFHDTVAKMKHFENVMSTKVLSELKVAEAKYAELEENRKENCRKASIICPESEIEALGECKESSPEELSGQLSSLTQRLQHESRRFKESIEEVRMSLERKRRKIVKKQQTYKASKDKLDACKKALALRQSKFQRNATLAKRELTWKFNGHLGKKGISGKVVVSYEQETLSIEVTMPQDASNKSVHDTRGLSGGERSFSTLCFALALHEMTEAPFRAMDEFDVFMDAVSRKISLDTLVDFALTQGSQWIFITPHDISMVKQDERIKKQQMAAPRA